MQEPLPLKVNRVLALIMTCFEDEHYTRRATSSKEISEKPELLRVLTILRQSFLPIIPADTHVTRVNNTDKT